MTCECSSHWTQPWINKDTEERRWSFIQYPKLQGQFFVNLEAKFCKANWKKSMRAGTWRKGATGILLQLNHFKDFFSFSFRVIETYIYNLPNQHWSAVLQLQYNQQCCLISLAVSCFFQTCLHFKGGGRLSQGKSSSLARVSLDCISSVPPFHFPTEKKGGREHYGSQSWASEWKGVDEI